MDSHELIVEQKGHVAIITLNRPESLNALTMSMMDALTAACVKMNDDPDVRCVILTGAGRGFCSGLDLRKNAIGDPKRRNAYAMLDFNAHLIARLRGFAKPTIAAVNGVAAGGGLGLALACDLRIAAEEARFTAVFANIGMPVQDAVGAFLPQVVGIPKALEMIYTARQVGGVEAKEIGLANEVVPKAQLMERAMALAEQIAAGPPVALAMSKQVVYRSWAKSLEDQLALQNLGSFLNTAYASHDVSEAMTAFTEKRKPKFKGP